MYDCSKKCQVQRCSLEKLPPKFKCDVGSEGHEQAREEALKLKLLCNSMILQNSSSPATFNWVVLSNIALRFSLSFWLWLNSHPASSTLSVLVVFLLPFPCSWRSAPWLPCQPSPIPALPRSARRDSVTTVVLWNGMLPPVRCQAWHRLHQALSFRMAKEQLFRSLLHSFGKEIREW